MDDTSGPVRDATAEALGTLLKVMGERPLNPYIEQLDKIKMDKVSHNKLFVVIPFAVHSFDMVLRMSYWSECL